MAKNPFDRYTRATVDEYNIHRLIGLSIGEPGSRKSSFWLEGPAPIVVLSFDRGMEGVVDRILRDVSPDKEVYVKEYEWLPTTDTSQQEAINLRDQYTADFENAIQNARTVIVDTETDLWELFRYAEFGAANDAPRNYPALNQRYRRLINAVKSTNCNLGLIERCKDEWVSSVNKKTGAKGAVGSGNRIRSGFGELDGLVHQVLYHTGVGPDTWKIEVGKARGEAGADVAGQTFDNIDFPTFSQMLFPCSDESEWS
jgi:hypothetical protein